METGDQAIESSSTTIFSLKLAVQSTGGGKGDDGNKVGFEVGVGIAGATAVSVARTSVGVAVAVGGRDVGVADGRVLSTVARSAVGFVGVAVGSANGKKAVATWLIGTEVVAGQGVVVGGVGTGAGAAADGAVFATAAFAF